MITLILCHTARAMRVRKGFREKPALAKKPRLIVRILHTWLWSRSVFRSYSPEKCATWTPNAVLDYLDGQIAVANNQLPLLKAITDKGLRTESSDHPGNGCQ